MSEYSQPGFYRFNEDSLILVSEILTENLRPKNLLDLGAGSGIIGIELALKLNVNEVHFLELQKEWAPYLDSNIRSFLPKASSRVFWTSFGEWSPGMKYDLIAGNPPYYLPGRGRHSPDPIRGKCRMFLQDSWAILLEKVSRALTPEGSAWFITPEENVSDIQRMAGNLPLEVRPKEELVILKISSPECRSKS